RPELQAGTFQETLEILMGHENPPRIKVPSASIVSLIQKKQSKLRLAVPPIFAVAVKVSGMSSLAKKQPARSAGSSEHSFFLRPTSPTTFADTPRKTPPINCALALIEARPKISIVASKVGIGP